MHIKDMSDACDALQEWCKSQGLEPYEAVQVAQLFVARMIMENASSKENLETKLTLVNRAIRESVAHCIVQRLKL